MGRIARLAIAIAVLAGAFLNPHVASGHTNTSGKQLIYSYQGPTGTTYCGRGESWIFHTSSSTKAHVSANTFNESGGFCQNLISNTYAYVSLQFMKDLSLCRDLGYDVTSPGSTASVVSVWVDWCGSGTHFARTEHAVYLNGAYRTLIQWGTSHWMAM